MAIDKLLENLNPHIIGSLKRAVELGKWPNGVALTDQQRRLCAGAITEWEQRNLPPDSRAGYVPPKETPCADRAADERELNWV